MRLSANLFGLLQPLQTVLRPSVGEQSSAFRAHRQYLDTQLLVTLVCLTALPIIVLTLGARAALVSVVVVLCLSVLGIVSVTHLKSLTLPTLVGHWPVPAP